MDRFPLYFIGILGIYLVGFLLALGYFIIPALSFALSNTMFYFISIVVFLPLILFLLYLFDEKKGVSSDQVMS